MRTAMLGATRGMGRSLARLLVERGDRVVLFGRDSRDLVRSSNDLQVRAKGVEVGAVACDLARPEMFRPAFAQAVRILDGLDCVVVTAAAFALQEDLERDRERTASLLTHNFTNTVLFCEEARERLLGGGGGTLCVFSSVAGERARKPTILYGASKAGLSRYLEGLDHKFRAQGLKTVCVKPGFVTTSMTAGLTPPPFSAGPDVVASRVLRAIDRGEPEVFAPWIWRWIMLAIRLLPRAVMRRIRF